jgi:glycerol-3-phosphate acyltransferase PlsX
VRIVLDAMGTDEAPSAEVAGAIEAMRLESNSDVEIILVGDEGLIHAELANHVDVPGGIVVHHAPDRVTVKDPPASVIRRKPESSIVVGLKLHKEGAADAFVSAGSTGAVMASSLFVLRPLPGVERSPVGTLLPTAGDLCLLLDAGANIGCKPRHLLQFAHLGTTYMRDVMDRSSPRVGLLNIGEEPGKGDELSVATYDLLQGDPGLKFIGNIEGRDIIGGGCDVIVCDGFVGNVLLKFYESVAGYIVNLLKVELASVEDATIDILDYAEYGGAPLLGLGGVSIICHGGSPPKAIQNAVSVAARAVRAGLVEHSAEELNL